ncbi:MAG: histidine kinase dimerization/phospho-acceptor domain-containing protein, partial [Candidatus Zixiibacteriota bacterium]
MRMDVVVYSLATLAVLVLLSSILLVRRYVRRYRVSDFEHAEIIRSLLEHNCGIVALTDGSGVINSTSHEFDKLFTPVGRRARVRSISDLLTERATHDYMSILDYIRRERRPILDLDITTLAGQTERNMTLTVTPVPSSGHSITSLINTFAYPKQPEQIETDLGHMEKLTNIGQITAGIAHELNTPLGSIILLTDVIGDTFTGSVPEEIHKIKAHAEHCSKVVRELLGYVRRGDGVKEKHDICGIIGKVKALVAAEAESRAIQIDINTADDEHSIVCNENQI